MVIPPLYLIVIASTVAGIVFSVTTWRSLAKFKLVKAGRNFLFAVVMFLATGITILLMVSHKGYQRLTKEATAAIVCIEPIEEQQFKAVVVFPDSTQKEYICRGDQLYIDAHILKWHPWLNLLGVHTTYEFDRLGGRYFNIDDEKEKERTVYALSEKKLLNLFDLRKKWTFLHPIVDAHYGSATFIEVRDTTSLEVTVSTSGLLIRRGKTYGCNRRE